MLYGVIGNTNNTPTYLSRGARNHFCIKCGKASMALFYFTLYLGGQHEKNFKHFIFSIMYWMFSIM